VSLPGPEYPVAVQQVAQPSVEDHAGADAEEMPPVHPFDQYILDDMDKPEQRKVRQQKLAECVRTQLFLAVREGESKSCFVGVRGECWSSFYNWIYGLN
jgi:hypothetical protein